MPRVWHKLATGDLKNFPKIKKGVVDEPNHSTTCRSVDTYTFDINEK